MQGQRPQGHRKAGPTARRLAGRDGASTRAGSRKLIELGEAIRRHVEPGMCLHLAGGIGGPGAAICELIRRFDGQAPRLAIVQSTVCGHALNLVHRGLAERLVCAVAAEISGAARPSGVIQKACADGTLELENWSLLSLQQRLMAGAYGVPFMPTRSVLGSSIAQDNARGFRTIADPFDTHVDVGAVRALEPDLSIVHGCIGDVDGNTVLASPAGEDLWGAYASRNGVLVTVEKIVPAEVLRRYSAMVRIPGHMVASISEVPLGLHPFSLPDPGIGRFAPYEKDAAFLDGLGEASRSPESLDAWIRHWVLDCASHGAYLRRLGSARVAALKRQARASAGGVAAAAAPRNASRRPADAAETMLVVVAREIVASVNRSGHRTVLAGAGVAAMAAFLAYRMLEDDGLHVDLLTGNGQVGFVPVPGGSVLATQAGVRSSRMLTDTVTLQGVLVGGASNRCLSVLGAGQVDRFGNINSTRTSDGRFLVGSGGANDALNAREVILLLNQSRERFVEHLPYVTGRGERVRAVVSSMGILRKAEGEAELELTDYFADAGAPDRRARLAKISDACGWPLRLSEGAAEIASVTARELGLLRRLQAASERP